MDLADPTHLTPLGQLRHGLGLLPRAARLVGASPELRRLALVPILLMTVLLGVAIAVTLTQGPDLVGTLLPWPARGGLLGTAARGAWWVGSAALLLLVLMALALLAWVLGNVLASPFHDRLSERLEGLLRPDVPARALGLQAAVGDILQGLAHSGLAVVLWVACSCPLVLLEGVPLVGPILHTLASLGLAALFLAREVLDFSASRRRATFLDKLGTVRDHAPLALGLGLGTLALLAVPVLNLLSMPVAVAAGTLLYVELEAAGSLPPPRR